MSARYELRRVGVFDLELDRVILKDDPAWPEWEAWMQTHTPDPMPPEVAPRLSAAELAARAELDDQRAMRATLRQDGTVAFLRTHTPAEIDAWVVANVTDLASAKTLLRKLAVVVAYMARERLSVE